MKTIYISEINRFNVIPKLRQPDHMLDRLRQYGIDARWERLAPGAGGFRFIFDKDDDFRLAQILGFFDRKNIEKMYGKLYPTWYDWNDI